MDGTTRPTRPDPVIHTPYEPPLDFQRKRTREDGRARRTRREHALTSSTLGCATRVAPRASKGNLLTLLDAGAQRRRMSTKAS